MSTLIKTKYYCQCILQQFKRKIEFCRAIKRKHITKLEGKNSNNKIGQDS